MYANVFGSYQDNYLLEKGIFIDVFLSTITMKAFLIEIYGKTWSNGKFLSL